MGEPRLIKGGSFIDDRGIVTFCNGFDMGKIKRFYMLENWQEGYTRAWHGHFKEAKWIVCVSGAAIVSAIKIDYFAERRQIDDVSINRFVLHPNGDVLYIPPGYANGHKNLVQNTRLIHFSNLYQKDTKGDDVRFDASIYGHVWEVKER